MNKEQAILRLQKAESFVVVTISDGHIYTDIDLLYEADRKEFVEVLGEELAKLKRAKLRKSNDQ